MAPLPAIAALSDDVLLFIFSIIAPSWWIDADLKTIRHVSQVCVHWRRIALGSPSLWRVISIGQCPRKWHEELLMRASSETSIDVINNHRVESFMSLIPKLRLPLRVYWGWVTGEEMRWILNEMQSPQGRMEYLNVTFRINDRNYSEVIPLPSTRQVPSLKELCLNKGMLDLSPLLFPNLKILKLNLYSLPTSTLFQYLANLPSLVVLTLNLTINHISRVSLPILEFPNLTHLAFSDGLHHGWYFLSHIRSPPKCHFHLQFKIGNVEPAKCYTSTVSFVLDRLREFDIHKLTIAQSTKGISITTSHLGSGAPQTSLIIDDVMDNGISANDHQLVLRQLDQALHILNFRDLEIDMTLPGDSYQFTSLPSHAPEKVKLTNCYMNFSEPIFAFLLLLDISTINPKIEVCNFFNILKNMAVLESLRVENALIESVPIDASDYSTGKLTRFAYTGSGGAYGQLISKLSLPLCQFELDLAADTIEPYLRSIMNSFAQGIRHAQKDYAINALTVAQVVHEPSPRYRGRPYTYNREPVVTCSDSSLQTSFDPDNKIHIRFREFATPLQNLVMKSLLAALDSVYVDFNVLHSCHITEMMPHLHKFLSLRILNVMTIDDLDDTTSILPLLKRAGVHDRPIFPSLTTLILDACNLRVTPGFFSILCSVLDWRRRRQAPIINLVFSFKYFAATEIRKVHIETIQAMGVCIETSDLERGRSQDLHFDSRGFLVIE